MINLFKLPTNVTIALLLLHSSILFGQFSMDLYESHYLEISPEYKFMILDQKTEFTDNDGNRNIIRLTGSINTPAGQARLLLSPNFILTVDAASGRSDDLSMDRYVLSIGRFNNTKVLFRYGSESWTGTGKIITDTSVKYSDDTRITTWWFDLHSPFGVSFNDGFITLAEGHLRIRRSTSNIYQNTDTVAELSSSRDESKAFDISFGGSGEALFPFFHGSEDSRIRSGIFLGMELNSALTDGSIPFFSIVDMPLMNLPSYTMEFGIEPGIRWGSGDFAKQTPSSTYALQISYPFHGIWYGASGVTDSGIDVSYYRRDFTYGPRILFRMTF